MPAAAVAAAAVAAAAAAAGVVAAVVAGCYCVVGDVGGVDAGDSGGAAVVVADGVDGGGGYENDGEVCWRRWLSKGCWRCGCDGNGREPRSLIRALPRRRSLVLFFLPKQVRGPVREIEESEYDGEEDP